MAKLFSRFGRRRSSDAPIATIKPTECDVSEKAEDADESKDASLDEPADDGPAIHPHVQVNAAFVDRADLDPEFLDKNGRERVIETAHDFCTRLISLEDDPSLPVHTIRMWTIGLGLTCFGAVLGQIFTFRPQEYDVSGLFLQIFAYVLGTGWYKVFPKPGKGRFWEIFNPGPFNIKEHVCITVMASTGSHGALAISTFAAEKLFYNIDLNYGVAIFTLIASQFFGYGLGGLFRLILVYPTFAVWPSLIPSVSLIETLHREPDLASQKKRYRFFWIGFIAIFVWEWFPEIIAPTLTGISVFCLANRTNPNFTRVFGGSNGNEGLGLFSIGLDWLQITSLPLYMPWATTVSKGLGVVLCIVVSIAGYFGNVWNAKNYPFLGQNLFYENGTRYHQSLILDAHFNLNKTALAEQGLPSYAWTNAMRYLGVNLSVGASITHVILWYRKDLIAAWNKWRTNVQDDPHYLKMQAYPECSMWVYFGTAMGAFVIALATLYGGHTGMPWYALIVAALVSLIELPILCVMTAITGFRTPGSSMFQMLGSALVPGNARANLYFGLYSTNSIQQGSLMVKDLKLGQYTKVPPRAMFMVQAVGTLLGSILNLIVMNSIVNSQREILLSVEGSNLWSGNVVQSYNTQAVSWGALGKEMYGPHNKYFLIPLGLLIGLFVPVPFYLGHRLFPKLRLDRLITPQLVFSLGFLSVGINSGIMSLFLLAIWSQFYMRKRHPTFFRKYNYLLAAALDGGTDFMVFISTFAVNGGAGKQYTFPTWALNPKGHYDYCAPLPKHT
ncbi:hypothetical protein MVLG_03161 [Microbotryum lychnidis-dioicae p1A1 Lamole]|uniref:OPT family small oligopeptide transporter n=1 Tax=Microbotryum lychnidis-dioicae (strain p1A1 Lamole / MvSl-1064) TaxID=683840 RepID=U5H7C6_USTV1|nr:hypothetical protein MVLG_03161 [Microbotryum lychnidis-dioicae p1A1 Lamole]|eukprot:KDE06510.1 hypothetical protein MVLG_03161 [Microbotryum lychnidis-dioicae p1A1 Lamole]